MALTDYTNYATIRGLLGVAATEIKDTVLELSVYELQFQFEMEDVDGGVGAVLTEFDRITAIDPADSRTADEARYLLLVGQMAAYSVARQLLGSVEMFAPKKITDGSAAVERDTDPYTRLREATEAGYNTLLTRLKDLLLVLVPAADVPAATLRTYISSTGLATDPVTGV